MASLGLCVVYGAIISIVHRKFGLRMNPVTFLIDEGQAFPMECISSLPQAEVSELSVSKWELTPKLLGK